MKYKLLTRRVTLVIYSDHDEVNYVASCQININGNKCFIDTVNGEEFYRFFIENGLAPFKELGLIEISGFVSASHYRLLKKIFPDIKTNDDTHSIDDKIQLIGITIPVK